MLLAERPIRRPQRVRREVVTAFAGGGDPGPSLMPSLGIIGPLCPSQSGGDGRPPDGGWSVIVVNYRAGTVSRTIKVGSGYGNKRKSMLVVINAKN